MVYQLSHDLSGHEQRIPLCIYAIIRDATVRVGVKSTELKEYKERKSDQSGKEVAKDVPSWAKGEKPLKDENGKMFAKRLLDKSMEKEIMTRVQKQKSIKFRSLVTGHSSRTEGYWYENVYA